MWELSKVKKRLKYFSLFSLSPILSDLPSVDDHCFVLMTDNDAFNNNIDENCVKFVQTS